MLSPDAVYAKVAEAAEAASDGYLIKPHTEKALRDRLALARQRKHVLKGITDHIERQAFTEAAQLCQQRVEARCSDWLLAARIGAELWLRVGQPRAALAMFRVHPRSEGDPVGETRYRACKRWPKRLSRCAT